MSANTTDPSGSFATPEQVLACAPVLRDLRRYATEDVETVKGWLQAGPRAVIWSLLDAQALAGVRGNVMEIGVFQGRTFGLLASSLVDGDRAVAIDPFGSDERRDAFIANMKRLGLAERTDLRCVTSVVFASTPERDELAGTIRFLSLDGAHDQEAVAIDLSISETLLGGSGIVAFDDFFNPWYPEVTAALFEHLAAGSALVPFAIAVNFGPPSRGANKLFLSRAGAADRYRECLRWALPRNLRKGRHWQGAEVDVYDFENGVFKRDPLLAIESDTP
jgi:hypothetical protein